MQIRHSRGLARRILIVGVTAWGLLMIVPDLYRVIVPLGSAGFAADNDGRIYDVRGPFAGDSESPAWTAGLRVGDHIDIAAMRCAPPRGAACSDLMSVIGGMGGEQLVRRGRLLTLTLLPADGRPAHAVTVAAKPAPRSWLSRFVLLLNEIAGIAVVLAAAWLFWTRPSAMTMGFWLYAIWFNPGQDFVYYLVLQEQPILAIAQLVAASIAHGLACAGLLLFVLRVPNDASERGWRYVIRSLPVVAIVIAGIQLVTYTNVFGYPTEGIGRASFFIDYAVDALAVLILLRRRLGHPPQEYQRMRWIIWGCLIGLPAYILSGILQSTSLWHTLSGSNTIPEGLVSLLLLTYGIFGWFVFEALRRPRVVNVAIPLRRLTVFGLLLSVPAVFADRQTEHLHELLHLPDWAWVALASVLLFLLGRLHELSAELADRVFNRTFRRHAMELREVGGEILRADRAEAIERLLVEAPLKKLDLASATVFRRDDVAFRRHGASPGWSAGSTESLDSNDVALAGVASGKPFQIDPDDADQLGFPHGLAAPTVAVPVRDKLRLYAVALYGPHESGADLTTDERDLLGALADDAALAYARAETTALGGQVAALERRLSAGPSSTG